MKCTSGWSGGTQEVIVNRVSICQNGNKLGNWSRRKHNDKMLDIRKIIKKKKSTIKYHEEAKRTQMKALKLWLLYFPNRAYNFAKAQREGSRSARLQYSLIVYWAIWIITLWTWIKMWFSLFWNWNWISKIWCEVCGGKIHISAFYPLGISECPHKLQGLR